MGRATLKEDEYRFKELVGAWYDAPIDEADSADIVRSEIIKGELPSEQSLHGDAVQHAMGQGEVESSEFCTTDCTAIHEPEAFKELETIDFDGDATVDEFQTPVPFGSIASPKHSAAQSGPTLLGSSRTWTMHTWYLPGVLVLPFVSIYCLRCWSTEPLRIIAIAIPAVFIWVTLFQQRRIEKEWPKQFTACFAMTLGLFVMCLGAFWISLSIILSGGLILGWGAYVGNRRYGSYLESLGLFGCIALTIPLIETIVLPVIRLVQSCAAWSISGILDCFGIFHFCESNVIQLGAMEYLVRDRLFGLDGLLPMVLIASFAMLRLGRSLFHAAIVCLSAVFWLFLGYIVHGLIYLVPTMSMGDGELNSTYSIIAGVLVFGFQGLGLYWTDWQLRPLLAALPYDSYLQNSMVRMVNRTILWPTSKTRKSTRRRVEMEPWQFRVCRRNLIAMTLVTFLLGGLGLLSMTYFAQTRPTTMQTPFSGRLETLGMLATSGGVLKRVKDGEDPNNGVSRLAWQQFESKANEEVRLVGGWDEEQLWDSVANQSVPIPRGSNELHIQACGLENSWPWYFEERVGLTKPSAYYFETGFDSRGLPLRPSKLKGLFDRVARRFQKNMLSLTMTRYKQVGPKFVIVYSIESESRFDAKQLNESMDRFLEIRQLVKESIDTQDDERE